MGKRELFIILSFVAAGVGVYQLTVPREPGGAGFSVETMLQNLSRAGRRERATASTTLQGTVPSSPSRTHLRLTAMSNVVVIGETRTDLAYEVTIEADAGDQAGAREAADRAVLIVDDAGGVVTLSPRSVPNARLTTTVTVRVPRQLQVRIDGARRTHVSGVGAVALRVTEEATVNDIAGAVTGSHRNGELTISDVGSVALNLVESRAHLSNVTGSLRLSARNGESRLDGHLGPVEIDLEGHRTVVVGPASGVQVTGTGGVRVENPKSDVRIDVRRTTVDVLLDAAVPVTVFTSQESIELQIDPSRAVTIDARADEGTIVAADLGLSPDTGDEAMTLRHRAGDAAQITLRNQRGEIVIAQRKW